MHSSPPIADGALSERLRKIVTSRADSLFGISGAVFAVMNPAGAQAIVAAGIDATRQPVHEQSPMPLASASKLATGLLILRLVEDGVFDLDRGLGSYLPDSAAADRPDLTIRRLLSHTSGLPLEIAHVGSDPPGSIPWQAGLRWPGRLAQACLAAVPTSQPGTKVQYSNIGYGLLGLVAERQTGQSFADLLRRRVFEPLRIDAEVGRLSTAEAIRVADVPSPHVGTRLEPYNGDVWLGMGAPWAGVVTDAAGLLRLVRAYAPEAGFLSPELTREATSDQTGGVDGGFRTTEPFLGHGPSRSITWSPCPWGLAVEVQGGKQPHWAPPTMPASFGQIGSSGCLAWHDPTSGVSWAFLGARTTESGWLLRHGARIAQSAIAACRGDEPAQATV